MNELRNKCKCRHLEANHIGGECQIAGCDCVLFEPIGSGTPPLSEARTGSGQEACAAEKETNKLGSDRLAEAKARTLADYRPQHDEDCDSRRCAVCGGFDPRQVTHADCICVGKLRRNNFGCSCGLDTLLAVRSEGAPQEMERETAACEDCGKPYPFGIDLVLSDSDWLDIHPGGDGGLLCAGCIAQRAAHLPHSIVLFGRVVRADEHDAFRAIKNQKLTDLARARSQLSETEIAALRAGIADIQAGRVRSLAEIDLLERAERAEREIEALKDDLEVTERQRADKEGAPQEQRKEQDHGAAAVGDDTTVVPGVNAMIADEKISAAREMLISLEDGLTEAGRGRFVDEIILRVLELLGSGPSSRSEASPNYAQSSEGDSK